jgi:hypothetical protein
MRRAKQTRRPRRLLRAFAVIHRTRTAKRQQYHFTVVAGNGQVISVSEMYSRKAGAIRGARRAFPFCTLRDRTGEKSVAA